MHKLFRILGFALLAILISLIIYNGPFKRTTKPNIVLIVIDTLRPDHLPFHGYDKNTAPFLAHLRSKSTVFENVFSTSSWTAPATASLFTSLYPVQHGVLMGYFIAKNHRQDLLRFKLNRIPDSIDTIAEVLQQKGYKTIGVADNINLSEEEGFAQGFSLFTTFVDKGASFINQKVKELKQHTESSRPYFLYIHYNDPHFPYKNHAPGYQKKDDFTDERLSAYDSEISYVDERIKELFTFFKWNKNTLLIITSDHGEEFNEHGQWGHGSTLFGEVLRVPLMVYFPEKFPEGKSIQGNVSIIDIFPTIREIIGMRPLAQEAGKSLLPIIARGKLEVVEDRVLLSSLLCHHAACYLNPDRDLFSIITGEFKYIRTPDSEFLFNLTQDKEEKHNILTQNPEKVKFLKNKMEGLRAGLKKYERQFSQVSIGQDALEKLKSLGYLQ